MLMCWVLQLKSLCKRLWQFKIVLCVLMNFGNWLKYFYNIVLKYYPQFSLWNSITWVFLFVAILHHGEVFVTPWTIAPGSSVHGISQAKILKGVAISCSREYPDPGIKHLSLESLALAGRFFTIWDIWSVWVKEYN